jgi:hypothetical protein
MAGVYQVPSRYPWFSGPDLETGTTEYPATVYFYFKINIIYYIELY